LALVLAERLNGEIVNADSGQLYREFPVLSAMPRSDLREIPHHLYGVLSYEKHSSVGWWRAQVLRLIKEIQAHQRRPIIVGGTGLYLKALLEGLHSVPPIPEAIRLQVREQFIRLGREHFWQELVDLDPLVARHLRSTDSQRMQRAYEVQIATQHSLFSFHQTRAGKEILTAFVVRISPPPQELYAACDSRFDILLKHGALKEVSSFWKESPSPEILARIKTIGFGELSACIKGERSLEDAVSDAKTRTRHYAKRQNTWFRHQLRGDVTIHSVVSLAKQTQAAQYVLQGLDLYERSIIKNSEKTC
jgi:tRNA dimethylallyltransferase